MKGWPNPVEPRGFAAYTTYPYAAQTSGFHRVDQPSIQAPWGPPWIRKTAGYFLAGSKSGGVTTHAWRAFPSEERVKRSETRPSARSRKDASLTWVSAVSDRPSAVRLQTSGARESVLVVRKSRPSPRETCSSAIDPPLQTTAGAPPSSD